MANSNLVSSLEKAVAIGVAAGVLSEGDVLGFINERLAEKGLALAGATAVTRRKAKPEKVARKPRAQAQSAGESDGKTHWAAILEALGTFDDGCKSADLKAKLEEMGHAISTPVFHTTMAGLMKEKSVKKTGKTRNYVYSLSAQGSKLLTSASEAEASAEDSAAAE